MLIRFIKYNLNWRRRNSSSIEKVNIVTNNILIKGTPNTKERIINTNITPLPGCDMINYKPLVICKSGEYTILETTNHREIIGIIVIIN